MQELKILTDGHWVLSGGEVAHVFNKGTQIYLSFDGEDPKHSIKGYGKFFEVMTGKVVVRCEEQFPNTNCVRYIYDLS